MSSKWIALTLTFTFGIGLFVGKVMLKPEIITNTETVVDTLWRTSPPDTVYQTAYLTKTLVDTFIVTKSDTIFIKKDLMIAKADTSFKEGDLHAEYYFSPVNVFKFDWIANPVPIQIKTQITTITVKPKWWERNWLWGGVGLLIGVMAAK